MPLGVRVLRVVLGIRLPPASARQEERPGRAAAEDDAEQEAERAARPMVLPARPQSPPCAAPGAERSRRDLPAMAARSGAHLPCPQGHAK